MRRSAAPSRNQNSRKRQRILSDNLELNENLAAAIAYKNGQSTPIEPSTDDKKVFMYTKTS
jgi:hypothetical protein